MQEKCKENQEFIFNKENQLVKTEIQKQELKKLDKELDEKDESINRNLEELKNINDDEMKLVLYYKLIKLSQVSFGEYL